MTPPKVEPEVKSDEEVKPGDEPDPTGDEPDDGLDLDKLIDSRVDEKLKGFKPPTAADEVVVKPGDEPPKQEPPSPAPASGVVGDVESVVRRVLSEKERDQKLADIEAKVNTPPPEPEPKPKRRGLGALIWGPDR